MTQQVHIEHLAAKADESINLEHWSPISVATAVSVGIQLRVVEEPASYSTLHVVLMFGSPHVSPKDRMIKAHAPIAPI